MDWKISLDRYLTSPPDDGFDDWAESVMESHTDLFYDANSHWLSGAQYDKWLVKCFDEKNLSPKETAQLIERAHRLYQLKKCPTCNKEHELPLHNCPYAEEINNDSEKMCNCCQNCIQECMNDI